MTVRERERNSGRKKEREKEEFSAYDILPPCFEQGALLFNFYTGPTQPAHKCCVSAWRFARHLSHVTGMQAT